MTGTASERRARHRRADRVSGVVRAAGLPWSTLVLLVLAVAAASVLLRPDVFSATATVQATSDRAAGQAAVELTRRDVLQRVHTAVELEPEWRGRVRLSLDHPQGEPVVLVTATSQDPRLAALAADTAAALVITDRADLLALARPATVPADPDNRPASWWWAVGAAALALALLVEVLHHRWELRHVGRPLAPADRERSPAAVGDTRARRGRPA